jgi:hypothetical protein
MSEMPEENPAEQMMSRFRREKESTKHLSELKRIASNIKIASQIAVAPREIRAQAATSHKDISDALKMHMRGGDLAAVSAKLKPAVDGIMSAGHAIFSLGPEVTNKLIDHEDLYPGVSSDMLNSTIGQPAVHLDNFIAAANKGN